MKYEQALATLKNEPFICPFQCQIIDQVGIISVLERDDDDGKIISA